MSCGKVFSLSKEQLEYLDLANFDINEPIRCECGNYYSHVGKLLASKAIPSSTQIAIKNDIEKSVEADNQYKNLSKVLTRKEFVKTGNDKKMPDTKKMAKITFCVLTTLLIIAGYFTYAYGVQQAMIKTTPDEVITVKATLNVDMVSNNSVGNSWLFEGNINGNKITSGQTIKFNTSLAKEINVSAKAIESDSIPDAGTNSTRFSVNNLRTQNVATIPVEVTVRENRGRYSGNTARWKFSFKLEREIPFSKVISSLF